MLFNEFSHELSIGNSAIDTEHQKLNTLIVVMARSIDSGNFEVLLEAIELFEENLCAYFKVEENIARAFKFDFSEHKLAHQEMLTKFKRIKDMLITTKCVKSKLNEDFIYILKERLIQHIKMDSLQLKASLSTEKYDFNPCDPTLSVVGG